MSKHNSHDTEQHNDEANKNVQKAYFMNGLNGNYDFNISDIFKRAWQLSKKNNWTLVQGLLCIIGLSFIVYLLFLTVYGVDKSVLLDPQNSPLSSTQQVTIEMTLTILLAPIWTGVAMLAIYTARDKTLNALSIFSYFNMLPMLAIASVIVSVFLTFGMMLLFVPGLYIFMATTFTLPLIVDKKLSPIQAIIMSIKMVNTYLTKMIILYSLFVAMLFLVIISFGIAYLWIGPLYFNVKAILYQDLFCKGQHVEYSNDANNTDGVFDA